MASAHVFDDGILEARRWICEFTSDVFLYFQNNIFQVHGAVELLLNCNISRERFVEFAVENTLLNLPYRTEEINELLVKIRSMEPRQ